MPPIKNRHSSSHDGLHLVDCPAKAATGMHARLSQSPAPAGPVDWLVTPQQWCDWLGSYAFLPMIVACGRAPCRTTAGSAARLAGTAAGADRGRSAVVLWRVGGLSCLRCGRDAGETSAARSAGVGLTVVHLGGGPGGLGFRSRNLHAVLFQAMRSADLGGEPGAVEAAFARTQARVLDLREQWKRWRTLVVPLTLLAEAEMVFLTSGALGLAPVRQVFARDGAVAGGVCHSGSSVVPPARERFQTSSLGRLWHAWHPAKGRPDFHRKTQRRGGGIACEQAPTKAELCFLCDLL